MNRRSFQSAPVDGVTAAAAVERTGDRARCRKWPGQTVGRSVGVGHTEKSGSDAPLLHSVTLAPAAAPELPGSLVEMSPVWATILQRLTASGSA